PRTPSPSQARQRSLPGFGHQKKPTHATTRFGQEDRIRQGAEFYSYYKDGTTLQREAAILRRRRTTIPARPSAQGGQHKFKNSQSRSRNFHGSPFGCYEPRE